MSADPPKREVRDIKDNRLLCTYEGGDVPRRGEPLTITMHDGGGNFETKTFEVIGVSWAADRHEQESGSPEAWCPPLCTIQVAEREPL